MKVEMPAIQSRHTDEEIQAAVRAMRECKTYSQGDELRAFEKEFADYLGAHHAIGLSSATACLEMAAMLSRVGKGDEVVMPGHTFVSSAVPFGRSGARIVWADIDPDTRVASVDTIRACVTDKTRVVLVTHLYGLCAEMAPIADLCKERNILLVEDCAQSPGAERGGKKAGTFGDFGCFSFHTHKNMTTLGEGGMLVCRDEATDVIARKLRWMGNWPFEKRREKYWVPAMGDLVVAMPGVWPVNYCLGEVQAAVGRLVLKRLDAINENRREQAASFRSGLADCPELSFQKVTEPRAHVYHLLSARVNRINRDGLMERLHKEYEIKCIVQYIPLYRAPLFKAFGLGQADCPNSDAFFDNMISFPWWTKMPEDVLDYMAQSTRSAISELRQR